MNAHAETFRIVDADECPLAGVRAIESTVLDQLRDEPTFEGRRLSLVWEIIGAMQQALRVIAVDLSDDEPRPIAVGIIPADMVEVSVVVAALRINRMYLTAELTVD